MPVIVGVIMGMVVRMMAAHAMIIEYGPDFSTISFEWNEKGLP